MPRQWSSLSDEAVLRFVYPLAAFLLTLLILLFVRRLIIQWLRKHSRDEPNFARTVLETFRFPSLLWCIAGAVQLGLEFSIIPQKYTGRASQAIAAFLIVSLSMV